MYHFCSSFPKIHLAGSHIQALQWECMFGVQTFRQQTTPATDVWERQVGRLGDMPWTLGWPI